MTDDSGADTGDDLGNVIDAAELFQDPLQRIVTAAKDEPSAPFASEALKMLAELRRTDRARFEATRAELKRAGVRVTALDEALDEEAGDSGRTCQADRLVQLATEAATLFHAPDGTAYADFPVNGHRETWPVRSKGFRRWLGRLYYAEAGGAANAEATQAALGLLEATAHYDGPEMPVFLRVGGHAGKIYLDLCDDDWRAAEIDASGWQVVADPPVRFRRAAGMRPLPVPVAGGSIAELRPRLNIKSDADFVLAVAWLLAALRPSGPYPVLTIVGEQASAKSTFSATLKSLVDPNSAPLRTLPREDRDLFIAAMNSHVLAFDNLTGLPPWLSDTLCRLATGGGFATRQLYSDSDEVLFDAQRPVLLNGIDDVIARPDLADRAIMLTLDAIPDERRKPEAELAAAFEVARPRILGALLDAVSHGLRTLPRTKLDRLPRMADFALWATACECAYGPAGTFMLAYDGNRADAVALAIEADPVGNAVLTLATNRTVWTGSASDLLDALKTQAGELAAKAKSWPASAEALSKRLRRLATVLRLAGVDVQFTKAASRKRSRTIIICHAEREVEKPSEPSARPESASGANGLASDSFADGSCRQPSDADSWNCPHARNRPHATHCNYDGSDSSDSSDSSVPSYSGAENMGTSDEQMAADDFGDAPSADDCGPWWEDGR